VQISILKSNTILSQYYLNESLDKNDFLKDEKQNSFNLISEIFYIIHRNYKSLIDKFKANLNN
jgi:hypothetical protein